MKENIQRTQVKEISHRPNSMLNYANSIAKGRRHDVPEKLLYGML